LTVDARTQKGKSETVDCVFFEPFLTAINSSTPSCLQIWADNNDKREIIFAAAISSDDKVKDKRVLLP
jgi:hypothetical protein